MIKGNTRSVGPNAKKPVIFQSVMLIFPTRHGKSFHLGNSSLGRDVEGFLGGSKARVGNNDFIGVPRVLYRHKGNRVVFKKNRLDRERRIRPKGFYPVKL